MVVVGCVCVGVLVCCKVWVLGIKEGEFNGILVGNFINSCMFCCDSCFDFNFLS